VREVSVSGKNQNIGSENNPENRKQLEERSTVPKAIILNRLVQLLWVVYLRGMIAVWIGDSISVS
jgi:hypothetical protein